MNEVVKMDVVRRHGKMYMRESVEFPKYIYHRCYKEDIPKILDGKFIPGHGAGSLYGFALYGVPSVRFSRNLSYGNGSCLKIELPDTWGKHKGGFLFFDYAYAKQFLGSQYHLVDQAVSQGIYSLGHMPEGFAYMSKMLDNPNYHSAAVALWCFCIGVNPVKWEKNHNATDQSYTGDDAGELFDNFINGGETPNFNGLKPKNPALLGINYNGGHDGRCIIVYNISSCGIVGYNSEEFNDLSVPDSQIPWHTDVEGAGDMKDVLSGKFSSANLARSLFPAGNIDSIEFWDDTTEENFFDRFPELSDISTVAKHGNILIDKEHKLHYYGDWAKRPFLKNAYFEGNFISGVFEQSTFLSGNFEYGVFKNSKFGDSENANIHFNLKKLIWETTTYYEFPVFENGRWTKDSSWDKNSVWQHGSIERSDGKYVESDKNPVDFYASEDVGGADFVPANLAEEVFGKNSSVLSLDIQNGKDAEWFKKEFPWIVDANGYMSNVRILVDEDGELHFYGIWKIKPFKGGHFIGNINSGAMTNTIFEAGAFNVGAFIDSTFGTDGAPIMMWNNESGKWEPTVTYAPPIFGAGNSNEARWYYGSKWVSGVFKKGMLQRYFNLPEGILYKDKFVLIDSADAGANKFYANNGITPPENPDVYYNEYLPDIIKYYEANNPKGQKAIL